MAVSAIVHALAFILMLEGWWLGAHHFVRPGSRGGVQAMLAYVPGRVAPDSPGTRAAQPRRTQKRQTAPVKSAEDLPADASSGNAAAGGGEVSILHVSPFPRERPDLSAAGPSGDVVVDVEIGADGHVTRARARHGISPSIDGMVVATVEHWVFQPAVQNGRFLSSSQQLHFHYDRKGRDGCGWECFALEDR